MLYFCFYVVNIDEVIFMKEIIDLISPYSKAIVPLVVAGVLAVLAKAGLTGDMTLKDAITLIVTSGLVYLIPNKKA